MLAAAPTERRGAQRRTALCNSHYDALRLWSDRRSAAPNAATANYTAARAKQDSDTFRQDYNPALGEQCEHGYPVASNDCAVCTPFDMLKDSPSKESKLPLSSGKFPGQGARSLVANPR